MTDFVNQDLSLSIDKHFFSNNFEKLIKHQFQLSMLPKKIAKFWEMDFDSFIKALKVARISLALKDDLLNLFNQYKEKIIEKTEDILATEKEVNALTYELYGITDQEAKLIEQSINETQLIINHANNNQTEPKVLGQPISC